MCAMLVTPLSVEIENFVAKLYLNESLSAVTAQYPLRIAHLQCTCK
jgi:hypothetical protein